MQRWRLVGVALLIAVAVAVGAGVCKTDRPDWFEINAPARSLVATATPAAETEEKSFDSDSAAVKAATEVGRFQVVNGTPTMARHIMLVDTTTGETWLICDSRDGRTGWCPMPAFDSASTSK